MPGWNPNADTDSNAKCNSECDAKCDSECDAKSDAAAAAHTTPAPDTAVIPWGFSLQMTISRDVISKT